MNTTIRHAITDLVLVPALFGFSFAPWLIRTVLAGNAQVTGLRYPTPVNALYHALGDACGQRLGAGRLMRVRLDSFIATNRQKVPA
jgi:hypothetical protein